MLVHGCACMQGGCHGAWLRHSHQSNYPPPPPPSFHCPRRCSQLENYRPFKPTTRSPPHLTSMGQPAGPGSRCDPAHCTVHTHLTHTYPSPKSTHLRPSPSRLPSAGPSIVRARVMSTPGQYPRGPSHPNVRHCSSVPKLKATRATSRTGHTVHCAVSPRPRRHPRGPASPAPRRHPLSTSPHARPVGAAAPTGRGSLLVHTLHSHTQPPCSTCAPPCSQPPRLDPTLRSSPLAR